MDDGDDAVRRREERETEIARHQSAGARNATFFAAAGAAVGLVVLVIASFFENGPSSYWIYGYAVGAFVAVLFSLIAH